MWCGQSAGKAPTCVVGTLRDYMSDPELVEGKI